MNFVFQPGDVVRKILHFHFFCGLGAGAKGFNRGEARVGKMRAEFECIGGIDVMPAAIRDFDRATGVKGTVLDLFDIAQYMAFHGRKPPEGWREATVDDVRRAAGGRRPHIVFLSAPCKGFSGLLAEGLSKTAKYQALNGLTLRGVWLMLEAWRDDPPELIVFENVPRIAKRGRHLLDQIVALLRAYGYAVAETAHDCGEIGWLAQTRKRFLLVARHAAKVPNFLYEPVKRPLRAVGEVLDQLPLPGDPLGGPMHRVPSLQWKTWLRLAFVEAGSDWRSLNKLAVEDGMLRDFGIMPEMPLRNGALGVTPWEGTNGTVAGESLPSNGRFAVADPREAAARHNGVLGVRPWGETWGTVTSNGRPATGQYSVADPRYDGLAYGQFGVRPWDRHTGAVIGVKSPGQGGFAVADPRAGKEGPRFNNVFRIVRFGDTSPAVTGGGAPSAGGLAVADPRPPQQDGYKQVKYKVTPYDDRANAVIGASTTGQGAFALADPRPGYGNGTHHNILQVHGYDDRAKTVTGAGHPAGGALSVADPRPDYLRDGRDKYLTAGVYGVVSYGDTSGAVAAAGQHDNGRWSVADPRPADGEPLFQMPSANDNVVAVIRALDGTWHRPFTTLELAALQGMVDPGEMLVLDGLSDSAWRERIGNAVPPPAAQAIASVMGKTLLLAWSGETFQLSAEPIWVQPIAVGLSVATTFDIGAVA